MRCRRGFWSALFALVTISVLAPASAQTVRVGVYQDRPMVFMDGEGVAQGIYADVLRDLARREGWDLEFVPGTFPECLDRLDRAEIDLMTGIAYSDERARRWRFNHETLLSNWGQLYVPRGSHVKSLLDLDGATMAVLAGDIYNSRFRENAALFGLGCTYVEVDSFQEVLALVARREVDAGLVSRLVGTQHEAEYDVARSSVVCCPSELRFAAPAHSDPEVLSRIDAYLATAREERGSVYYQSLDRWLETKTEREVFPVWAAWLLLGTALVAASLLFSNLLFQRRLRVRTEELSRMSAQYHQAQKMEAVGRLAAGIAHDFNNQLSVIEGYCGILLEDVSEHELASSRVKQILQASQRAGSLTRQLLAFGRKQALCAEVVDVNLLVAELSDPLSRILGDDVSLVTEMGEGPLRIEVDAVHLQQALMNLASNARDAMPDGGRLSLRTCGADALASDSRDGSEVVLEIQDTGEGIPAEAQAQIFDPFFTTKPKGEGSGLGLAMVHGFVSQSGGSIEVHSGPERGTLFRIRLPRVFGEPEPAPAPAPEPATVTKRLSRDSLDDPTILLVEDNEAVRTYMVEVLERAGYHVIDAGSGQRAVELAQEHGESLSLLVTDVVMPEIDGLELASYLVGENPRLRVLFVTGYSEQDVAQCCESLEARASMLTKPFQPGGLVEAVQSLLRSQRET
jgi:signal transduction histidine kinase/ActR/RegA family two-component response regulator